MGGGRQNKTFDSLPHVNTTEGASGFLCPVTITSLDVNKKNFLARFIRICFFYHFAWCDYIKFDIYSIIRRFDCVAGAFGIVFHVFHHGNIILLRNTSDYGNEIRLVLAKFTRNDHGRIGKYVRQRVFGYGE